MRHISRPNSAHVGRYCAGQHMITVITYGEWRRKKTQILDLGLQQSFHLQKLMALQIPVISVRTVHTEVSKSFLIIIGM